MNLGPCTNIWCRAEATVPVILPSRKAAAWWGYCLEHAKERFYGRWYIFLPNRGEFNSIKLPERLPGWEMPQLPKKIG